MIRNSLFTFLGLLSGLWLAWPGVVTNKGWKCAKDIALNAESKQKKPLSVLGDVRRKLKITTSVSPKTLIRAKSLDPMEKLRIVGDACFRY